MIARDIEAMLRQKHAEDIFVAQCKTGPTQTGVQIFDGWALKPSWANQSAIGYEIKISRGDYLRDDKWRGYLPYCNEFYFVVPSGLLEKDEIPEGVGLITACGSRLLTKKKATYHDADPVALMYLYKYVLMYHSGLIKHNGLQNMTREERIAEWDKRLENKERIDQLGYHVGKKLRKVIEEEVVRKGHENDRLKHENEQFAEIKEALASLGFGPHNYPRWGAKDTLSARIAEVERGYPDSFKRTLAQARTSLEAIERAIEVQP